MARPGVAWPRCFSRLLSALAGFRRRGTSRQTTCAKVGSGCSGPQRRPDRSLPVTMWPVSHAFPSAPGGVHPTCRSGSGSAERPDTITLPSLRLRYRAAGCSRLVTITFTSFRPKLTTTTCTRARLATPKHEERGLLTPDGSLRPGEAMAKSCPRYGGARLCSRTLRSHRGQAQKPGKRGRRELIDQNRPPRLGERKTARDSAMSRSLAATFAAAASHAKPTNARPPSGDGISHQSSAQSLVSRLARTSSMGFRRRRRLTANRAESHAQLLATPSLSEHRHGHRSHPRIVAELRGQLAAAT
ncbi:uncharacterized protein PSFLO_05645 [Pseudozyma flocculosa]|uniref:Uncharacterized protein n=1 Tax=Pseudozyma flocculosa TaxID=84751 RepID=A0A5C3F6Q2_9BASI|nr:uncharacterized protein PSFLO_05645 [Pseudozyma flocculosa]